MAKKQTPRIEEIRKERKHMIECVAQWTNAAMEAYIDLNDKKMLTYAERRLIGSLATIADATVHQLRLIQELTEPLPF